MNRRVFPLWGFDNGQTTIFTRGETQAQAWEYIKDGPWERGLTVTFLDSLPIVAVKLYDQNHAPDWLYRPMYWLVKKENSTVVDVPIAF